MQRKRAEELVERFAAQHILVAGDLMLDEFVWGEVSRISPEAPVPVVEVTGESFFAGGAANVARNLREMGARASMAGVRGADAAGEKLAALLRESEIDDAAVAVSRDALTIVKTRVIARHQQVVRIDREQRRPMGPEVQRGVLETLAAQRDGWSAVIFSDYAKGFLTPEIAQGITELARGRVVTVDPSPLNPLPWRGVTAVKPNLREARAAAGVPDDAPPEETAQRLLEHWDAQMVLITMGEHGMLLLERGGEPYHTPTRAREVFDVSGAGDTAIAAGAGRGRGAARGGRAGQPCQRRGGGQAGHGHGDAGRDAGERGADGLSAPVVACGRASQRARHAMPITRRTLFQAAASAPAAGMIQPRAPLAPPEWKARWIWYPERRTIQNTFVMFRRAFDLAEIPAAAPAYVSAFTRYKLWVNGQFVQRGPAPCDPRYWEADPVELGPFLRRGPNVIAALVCCFGTGDGTYPPPAPAGSGEGKGFLFQCDALGLQTDASWKALRPRAWKHGAYLRWFLRALQEEFDARRYPEGWELPGYDDAQWKPAAVEPAPPGRPPLREVGREGWREDWVLQVRSIPPVGETAARPLSAPAAGWIEWRVDPEEYFECFPADAFDEREDAALRPPEGMFPHRLPALEGRTAAVTYDFGRELLGHPFLRLRAPAGTVVELLFCEKQVPGKLLLRIPPRFGQWLRVKCRDGVTEYESFEYECFRWMQIVVRGARGGVEILDAGVRERNYRWPHQPEFSCSDADVERAVRASLATHRITSQEPLVDNMVRERQQYAGDLDQAKLCSYYAFGETRQPARMIRTFAQGQNAEGWFMDCWPAWDRCQRLFQKHMGLTVWGPILDHALQFGIAVAEHFLWDADQSLLDEVTPRLERFAAFLESSRAADGLLPVLGWRWNTVWIDHIGYQREEDKHCAFNLYWAGFLRRGLRRLHEWRGDREKARAAEERAREIVARVRRQFWSPREGLLVDNLPRAAQDGRLHVHARTLSMALLFGALAPEEQERAVGLLRAVPADSNANVHDLEGGRILLGFNYPLNEIWRLWAPARAGHGAHVVRELRERWAKLPSVVENGTYAEFWNPGPSETGQVWCQSNPVPAVALYQMILGVQPTAPGFAAYELRPQPGDLRRVSGTVFTPRGPVRVSIEDGTLEWVSPGNVEAVLVLPSGRRRRMPASGKEQRWTVRLNG